MVMEAAHVNHQNLPSLAACDTFANWMVWECQTWTKYLLDILPGGEKKDLKKNKNVATMYPNYTVLHARHYRKIQQNPDSASSYRCM